MDILKNQLQQQLVSNVLKDKLKNNKNVIFDESKCTIHRCIRFTTEFSRNLINPSGSKGGLWDTGDYLMYEINLTENDANVTYSIDFDNVPFGYEEIRRKIVNGFNLIKDNEKSIIKTWKFSKYPQDIQGFFEEIDSYLNNELSKFESELNSVNPDLHEGESDTVTSTKYERNPIARKKCLEYYGTACMVCGMDFGKMFGPEFEGKIEVHHIVPVSEIGIDYVVDPIKDLVPLCPNCHTAIHSKKGGTYTVEELKSALNK